MIICFRVDASIQIGIGHIMRCLTLAEELRRRGAEIQFICREYPGNLIDYLEKKGFRVSRLPCTSNDSGHFDQRSGVFWPADARETKTVLLKEPELLDWLVIDHYGIDLNWEKMLRPCARKLMVIDDIADRQHNCDLLLDQNFFEDMLFRYESLIPSGCQTLLGPKYALLRSDFAKLRRLLPKRVGKVEQILVFFGGTDPTNETSRVLEVFNSLDLDGISIDVVVGGANPFRKEIENLCKVVPNVNFHFQVEDMAALMFKADLCIGAGGSTSWERCSLGLPSIVIATADNQKEIVRSLDQVGAVYYCGNTGDDYSACLTELFKRLLSDQDNLIKCSEICMQLVDGQGTQRVVNVIQDLS